MQTDQSDYFSAYRQLKLTRDAKGVLVVEFHSNGGPCIMNAQGHTEFVDAFYGSDRTVLTRSSSSPALQGTSLSMSTGHLSATSQIRKSGARFTTRVFRFWKTSPTYACR
jgi:hypothetical protein